MNDRGSLYHNFVSQSVPILKSFIFSVSTSYRVIKTIIIIIVIRVSKTLHVGFYKTKTTIMYIPIVLEPLPNAFEL